MSSADYSDEEDDYGQRSGTVSPAPGDTLPWNLPKHERSKRKIQGGSVLDPAERAVLRIAGECFFHNRYYREGNKTLDCAARTFIIAPQRFILLSRWLRFNFLPFGLDPRFVALNLCSS